MKKIAWLHLISLTLIMASCSLFGDIINPEKSVATADIDQKGGSIEATDILVGIPASAFDSQNSLEISEVKNIPTELVSVNSKLFVLEGLPLNANKGIKIKIKKILTSPHKFRF